MVFQKPFQDKYFRGGGIKPSVGKRLRLVSGLRFLHFNTFGGNNDVLRHPEAELRTGETLSIPSLGGGRSCVISFTKSLQIRERVFYCNDKGNLKSSKHKEK